MNATYKTLIVAAAAAAMFWAGRASVDGDAHGVRDAHEAGEHEHTEEAESTNWTCPMHPQIVLPDFGPCPICGMDLVRVEAGGGVAANQIAMSPAARELARIETAPVRRRNVTRPVRLVGKVDYDETAIRTISAWVAGRLDRLYVDYTGVAVSEGDHLVQLYSPDLVTAQEELLAARARLGATEGEASRFLVDSNRRAYESAREKLVLLGLTEAQVERLETRGRAEEHVMLTSPSSGIVIDKRLDEGAYVQTGTPIYRIAELDRLWVRLDAYEQDLAWLRHGQPVELGVEALPGESFEGHVSYIDPFIDDHTRTAKVRVNVDNRAGRLKPGMFVRGVALARLGVGGVVLDRHLAGKWVSPMHPEIVKDGPGECDICGMDLVPAEELGLVDPEPPGEERPLVVPASAVLLTGRRGVVYVEVPESEEPLYEGREVTLGPRAGDEYVVLTGLEEGERVVVNGAFRIDSSMQIVAKPSMLSQPGDARRASGPEAHLFRASLAGFFDASLELQVALAADDFEAARAALDELGASLEQPAAAGLKAARRALWSEEVARVRRALEAARASESIDALRVAYEGLAGAAVEVAREFGHPLGEDLREAYCPMAFDGRGGAWLQAGGAIANPYFGSEMLRCGDFRETFVGEDEEHGEAAGEASAKGAPHEGHEGHDHERTPDDEPASGDERGGASAPPGGEPDATTPDGDDASADLPAADAAVLRDLLPAYLEWQQSLAADDVERSRANARVLATRVARWRGDETGRPDLDGEPAAPRPATRATIESLAAALAPLGDSASLDEQRVAFQPVSDALIARTLALGNALDLPLHRAHCPMAFDFEGADWLQTESVLANPYFGAEMLTCGKTVKSWEARR